MPPQPHKGRSRSQQGPSQPQPQPSDYETDAPQIDVPPPPPRSNEQINLSVLKRHYPDVASLLHVAPYTVLYIFSLTSQTWEKSGIEGTLFVCQLTPTAVYPDRFSVVILNRRGLDNFSMDIVSDEEVEITDEYLILQGDQIYGLWIFSEPPPSSTANARVETANKILALAQQAAANKEPEDVSATEGFAASESAEESIPMGRQLSLRELFGQQRESDAAWSVHNHHSQAPAPQPMSNSGFMPSMNAGGGLMDGSGDHLGQLFMKARQNYNGVG
ncbi:PH domain-like protein [Aaosphaeria arxii CBS 175.79]|uniref:PH domain-like protein n=1 Tax=Aaosphaeria arxii CBS 175.79 TaxID=1450172 RepID=A0A6A5X787_9PLEO|nr:PH domain-like protein [Aaosphaeria arxii CBS 175.79]KAF2008808.1 PH domain-like protein [Aaosphaeria arxii CBS 175.79]